MKLRICIFCACVLPAGLWAQGVATPQSRMMTLDLARTLLTAEPIVVEADTLAYKNPFGSRRPVVTSPDRPAPVITSVNDRDVLLRAGEVILPSGTMMLGDVPILLFGQKKLKVGDVVPIVFQGKTYELQVSSIERTSFTLRLNKEEITRPIKPVNKP